MDSAPAPDGAPGDPAGNTSGERSRRPGRRRRSPGDTAHSNAAHSNTAHTNTAHSNGPAGRNAAGGVTEPANS